VSEAGWNDAIAINLTGSFLGAKHQIAENVEVRRWAGDAGVAIPSSTSIDI
jgi:hypothetical protein